MLPTHCACIINGVEVQLETTETVLVVYTRGSNTTIGAHGFNNTNFDYEGLIDDARVFSRALSAAEIADLANESSGSSDQSTVNDSVAITVNAVNDGPTFEVGDGIVTTDVGDPGDTAQANSVITLPDGKILAIGATDSGLDGDFLIIRYNADGSLDTTFDNDGIVTTTVGASAAVARDAIVQADGKIVVVGSAGSDTAVVRYNTDGSLDTTFGGGTGIVIEDIGSQAASDRGNSVALTSDGKILVAGSANDGSQDAFALTRLNSDGTLDTTFDGDGTVTTAITISDTANDIVVQQDGTILLTGQSLTSQLWL